MKHDKGVTVGHMLRAYAAGVFPMATSREDPRVHWVDPQERGIIPLSGFHISRSLGRRLRRLDYRIVVNGDFEGVVNACADREETWINDRILTLYRQLHRRGHAHSLEVWRESQLAGGVYGITLGRAFFGESMFSRVTDGSKIALAYLVDHLRRTGFRLFDTQFVTPHLASLGCIGIPRNAYHALLRDSLRDNANFLSLPVELDPYGIIHRNTHTS
ncbi:MAG: leucyl/phenylalanyl-tRNA--protein transferase [Rhodobacter sp.]|nr:leucyl/phenylalanyl-tRNA--protein transferase [Rhodobacter sp.]